MRKSEPTFLKFKDGEVAPSFHSFVASEMAAIQTAGVNRAAEQRVLKVKEIHSDATDVWGLLERGEYGAEASIRNTKTFAQTHLQRTDEALMQRLYFRLHLPDGAKKGLLLLQRTGAIGAYTELHRVIEERFRDKYPTHRAHFARAVHPDLLKEVLNGSVVALKIVTYKPTADITNYMKGKGASSNIATITITAEATPEKSFWGARSQPDWYKEVLTHKKSISEVFPHDKFKSFNLTTRYQGGERTFDLVDPEDIFPYEQITSAVTIATDGHPTFDSIDTKMIEIRDDLAKRLGITAPGVTVT